jgi:ribosomal protein S18 acetylase RimI-like enzyme
MNESFTNQDYPTKQKILVDLDNGEKLELLQLEELTADLHSDVDLGLDAFETTYSQMPESELKDHFGQLENIRPYYSQLIQEDDVGLFRQGKVTWIRAMMGDTLVGWMTLLPQFQNKTTVYISTLVVSPRWQKLGIGEKLLSSIAQHWFPEATELNLVTRNINCGATRLFKRLGFVPAPDIDSSFIDNPLHCFFMRLKL